MAIKMAREREIERGHGLFAAKFRDNFLVNHLIVAAIAGRGLIGTAFPLFLAPLHSFSRHLRSRDNRTGLIVSKLALRPAGRAHYLLHIINLY